MTAFDDAMDGIPEVTADDPRPAGEACTCTNYCPESEGGCDWCARNLDSYDPCPNIGFGCGTGGNDTRCDCCTDEQWIAAGGNPAIVRLDHGITS